MHGEEDARFREKIRKLLAMTEKSGCTPAEAAQAALMVRRLLAKREKTVVSRGRPVDRSPIVTVVASAADPCRLWGESLAAAVARSFRCKALMVRSGGDGRRKAAFFGHKVDAETACDAFEHLYALGDRLGREAEERGGSTAYDGMTQGFLLGVRRELAKQDVLLLMPVPEDVASAFEELRLEPGAPDESVLRVDNVSYMKGLQFGVDAMKHERKVE